MHRWFQFYDQKAPSKQPWAVPCAPPTKTRPHLWVKNAPPPLTPDDTSSCKVAKKICCHGVVLVNSWGKVKASQLQLNQNTPKLCLVHLVLHLPLGHFSSSCALLLRSSVAFIESHEGSRGETRFTTTDKSSPNFPAFELHHPPPGRSRILENPCVLYKE